MGKVIQIEKYYSAKLLEWREPGWQRNWTMAVIMVEEAGEWDEDEDVCRELGQKSSYRDVGLL